MGEWDDAPFIASDKPRKAALAPRFTRLLSFSRLIENKRASTDVPRFKAMVLAMVKQDTRTLIVRLSTTTDPLMLWAIHCQLDKRNIAPAQRWPANTSSDQMLFVNWCADLTWFFKRNPAHVPRFKSWRRLTQHQLFSPQWLEAAYWKFESMHGRSLAHITSKALGLSDDHRQDLLTVPTRAMVVVRREIEPTRFATIHNHLLSHALAHPDRSGKHKPADVANRRLALFRVFVLSGKHAQTTATHWKSLTGETIFRQAVDKQLTIILGALRSAVYFE